jgi:hypothetical protein
MGLGVLYAWGCNWGWGWGWGWVFYMLEMLEVVTSLVQCALLYNCWHWHGIGMKCWQAEYVSQVGLGVLFRS